MTARVALRLGRVSNLPTVWTNVLAGVVLAGATVRPAPVALLVVALSLFYVGGMYLNDAFDRDVDRRERPERPIPSGAVSATAVFVAGFALLAAGEAMVVPFGRPAVISGLLLAATIVWYDVRHKRDPLSPVVMGLCRVLVYVTAAVAVVSELSRPVVLGAAALLAYLIGLTYVAKQENLTEVTNLWPVACLAVPFAYVAPAVIASPAVAVIAAAFVVWVIAALRRLAPATGPDIGGAVVRLIAGISFLDALLVAAHGRPGVAAVAVAAVPVTRWLQRHVPGT